MNVPAKSANMVTVNDRLFLKNYMEDDCQNLSETFRRTFPVRCEKMSEQQVYTAASRLYTRLKKSVTFREMLEINGIDDASLVAEGKRLMHLKKPFFGPRGEIVNADDGPTQAKVWDRMTDLRGHGTGSKANINISTSGPLNIQFGEGSLAEENVEVSLPETEEKTGE